MPTVRLTGVQPLTGDAQERGFRVTVETGAKLMAYRVTVVWTADDWQSTHHTEAGLTGSPGDTDLWAADISFRAKKPTAFSFAISATGLDGIAWDNNSGRDHHYSA